MLKEGMSMIINSTGLKTYIKRKKPQTRVSHTYIMALESRVKELVNGHLHLNGGRKTIRAEAVNYGRTGK